MQSITRPLRHILAGFIGGLALLGTVVPASAEEIPIAQVKNVSGVAVIVRGGARLPAKGGDPLFEKDIIQTGNDGTIGITCIDNTVMSVGPDSELVLEEFRFDSSNFNGAMLTDMHKGTLSVVSGDIARSAPGAMKIKTADAILGVRGTRFVVEAKGD